MYYYVELGISHPVLVNRHLTRNLRHVGVPSFILLFLLCIYTRSPDQPTNKKIESSCTRTKSNGQSQFLLLSVLPLYYGLPPRQLPGVTEAASPSIGARTVTRAASRRPAPLHGQLRLREHRLPLQLRLGPDPAAQPHRPLRPLLQRLHQPLRRHHLLPVRRRQGMLSIGGGGYFFNSKQDAFQLAQYIWDNFLGGTSDKRPLGDAVLDGVDFNIEGGNPDYYGALAAYLKSFGSKQGKSSKKEVLLSAAPQCPFPGQWVGKALETGLFDYVQCGFSSTTTRSPCQYTPGSMDNLVKAWNQWTIRGSMRHTSSSACRLHRTRRGVGSSSRRQASTRRYDASGAQELHQVRRRDALVQVLR
jgi:hypothetical protein